MWKEGENTEEQPNKDGNTHNVIPNQAKHLLLDSCDP